MPKRIVILVPEKVAQVLQFLPNSKGSMYLCLTKGPFAIGISTSSPAGIFLLRKVHSMDIILAADEIIKSPGIQEKYPVMQAIRAANKPVIGEIEFAFRYCKGKVIAIITEGDEIIPGMADEVLYVPAADEIIAPMLSTIPLQLLSYYVGIAKGVDVDKPRNLAKSVTVE